MTDIARLPDSTEPNGAVAVIVREGRLLVIRRSQTVRAPGKFCFPGGGIQRGESETATLCRELKEELDVAILPVRRLWRSVTPWGVKLSWWHAELGDDQTPDAQPAEVESVHWMTRKEMLLLPQLLESNRQFLDALARGEFELDGVPV